MTEQASSRTGKIGPASRDHRQAQLCIFADALVRPNTRYSVQCLKMKHITGHRMSHDKKSRSARARADSSWMLRRPYTFLWHTGRKTPRANSYPRAPRPTTSNRLKTFDIPVRSVVILSRPLADHDVVCLSRVTHMFLNTPLSFPWFVTTTGRGLSHGEHD
jgi:hypothetical protein